MSAVELEKLIELQALITEREAMLEENATRESQGFPHTWPGSSFFELAKAMRALNEKEVKP